MQDPKTPAELKKRRLASNWIDLEITEKKSDLREVEQLLRSHQVPESFIESVLGAGSLPRFDSEGEYTFFLLRVFDEAAEKKATAAHELTRKLSVIACPKEIISVHRFPLENFTLPHPSQAEVTVKPDEVVSTLVDWALHTYTNAIARIETQFDSLEAAVFNAAGGKSFRLKEAYFLKRRLSIHKRMLELTRDALESAVTKPPFAPLAKTPIRRRIQRAIGATDTFLDGINHLLQLHLALVSQKTNEASQKTNDVMRVLTVFSAFFLPLSFIAGVYGMNFENMPELHHRHGYIGSLVLMFGVALGIFLWFRKRGWIGSAPPKA